MRRLDADRARNHDPGSDAIQGVDTSLAIKERATLYDIRKKKKSLSLTETIATDVSP